VIFLPDNQTNPQTEPPQIPTDIYNFLTNLIKEAGLIEFDETTHNEMLKELYARLDHHIASTIIENLPEDAIEEFIVMNEQQKPQQEIEQYLQSKIPDVQQVMTKAFMDFRNLYLGNIAAARSAPETNSGQVQQQQGSVSESEDLSNNQTS
jgi:hypothetical protein